MGDWGERSKEDVVMGTTAQDVYFLKKFFAIR